MNPWTVIVDEKDKIGYDLAWNQARKLGLTALSIERLYRLTFSDDTPVIAPVKQRFPTGKGVFTWRLEELAGGDVKALAQQALLMGFNWVAIKIANEETFFGADTSLASRELQAVGIKVWGWHYVTGTNPTGEAKVAISRVKDLGLAGYIIDAEIEYKQAGRAEAAKTFMALIAAELSATHGVGLCSYRYPFYHTALPWSQFIEHCDFHMPQLYWEGSHNPAYQLGRSIAALTAIKPLPVVPLGSAYATPTWSPTAADMHNFYQAVQATNSPGVGWYAWHSAVNNVEWWNEIKSEKFILNGE